MNSVDRQIFLSLFPTTTLTEVQYHIIDSCLMRGDRITALQHLDDWQCLRERDIFKYNPGIHYYVLDKKFDTLEQAKTYLLSQGYTYKSLRQHYVYVAPE